MLMGIRSWFQRMERGLDLRSEKRCLRNMPLVEVEKDLGWERRSLRRISITF